MELKLEAASAISISSFAVVLCIVYISTQFVVQYYRRKRLRSLPPGPFPLPVLGNLLNLGKKPHKSLAEIAKRYGPLISLRFGCLTTVVVSSSSVARELFQRNDAVSAERTVGHTTTVLGHHLDSVVFLPPGPKWRNLRRICNSHIFGSAAVNATARLGAGKDLQKEKVEQLISHLNNIIISNSNCEVAVNISQVMFTTSLNILSNTMFSIDMASLSSSSSAHELKELVWGMLEVGGIPNVSDFFPLLRWFDPQRLHRRASALVDRMIKMFDQIIEQRMRKRKRKLDCNCNCNQEEINKDVLDTLLNINQQINNDGDRTGIVDIPHLMLDLFVAGTDTTSSTIEWAMTELLRNPTKMVKAQAELDRVIGRNSNPVKETHIPDLPYLQAVIKETLRLHPPAPFLIPRKASQDMELCGFAIPKGTQILVNAWAMGRDETVWHNATAFEPERFIKKTSSSIDFFRDRNNYDLIPFGCGRRLCLGMPLALKILPLALGSLLHSFDWKLPYGMEPHQIDVDDKFGITLQKANSLKIVPLPRNTRSN